MRDLVFKNLTSEDRKRRIIASSEITDKEGMRTVIHRHFVCIVKEIHNGVNEYEQQPNLYVLKERNTKERKERFFCRIKGSLFAVNSGKLLLIQFMHSLRIELSALPEPSAI